MCSGYSTTDSTPFRILFKFNFVGDPPFVQSPEFQIQLGTTDINPRKLLTDSLSKSYAAYRKSICALTLARYITITSRNSLNSIIEEPHFLKESERDGERSRTNRLLVNFRGRLGAFFPHPFKLAPFNMPKTVMIFGAGASMPFYSPPLNTCTLTRQVQDERIWKSLLPRYAATIPCNLKCPVELDPILSLIERARDVRQCLDFEQLIEMVDKFSSFSLDDLPRFHGGFGALPKHQHLVFKFLDAKQPSQHDQYWQMVPFLFRQIIAETIENWDSQFRSKCYFDLEAKQSELLSGQLKRGDLSVYTFNFDDVLPQTVNMRELSLETGFLSDRFESEIFLKAPSILAFLHGLARWSWDASGMKSFPSICEANCWRLDHLFNSGLEETMNFDESPTAYDFNTFITTGLDKEPSFSRNPYSAYYQRISSDLLCADAVVVAGYSFRDPHIDRLLLNYLSLQPNKKKVLVIDRWDGDIELQHEYTNPLGPLRRVLDKYNVTSIPFKHDYCRQINIMGYGPFCRQVWIYKRGYGDFLDEWETVLDEWRNYSDPL